MYNPNSLITRTMTVQRILSSVPITATNNRKKNGNRVNYHKVLPVRYTFRRQSMSNITMSLSITMLWGNIQYVEVIHFPVHASICYLYVGYFITSLLLHREAQYNLLNGIWKVKFRYLGICIPLRGCWWEISSTLHRLHMNRVIQLQKQIKK
jgi:hypothetical protein